ncbi:MAG: type II secretion system protein [Candidatus Riflebacteria bacterium]|nr:type II secretion system protein [Candidatus Riflebacteria bacterium]
MTAALRRAWCSRKRTPPDSGFTLVELMLSLAISFVLATAVYLMLGQPRPADRVAKESASVRELRLKLKRLTYELQEGTRLIYPEPGQESSCGVGFVNARGQLVFYYTRDDGTVSGTRTLWRSNVNPSDCEEEEALIEHVHWFRVTTAAAGPGRAPSRVNLDLAASSTEATTATANMVTSVFLRSLEKNGPDDPTNIPWH